MDKSDLERLRKIFQARIELCETRSAEHRDVLASAPEGPSSDNLCRRIEWYDNLGSYLDSFLGDVLQEMSKPTPTEPQPP